MFDWLYITFKMNLLIFGIGPIPKPLNIFNIILFKYINKFFLYIFLSDFIYMEAPNPQSFITAKEPMNKPD